MDCAPAKKKTFEFVKTVSELLALRRLFENSFSFLRQGEQFFNPLPLLIVRKRAANLCQVIREEKQHRHLGGKSFGGRDADLGAGMSVEDTVSLAGESRTHDV